MRALKVIWEASTRNRLEAIQTHRDFLERRVDCKLDDIRLDAELKRTIELRDEMTNVRKNPRNHLVMVLQSRVAQYGAVGRVIYVNSKRNLCKIEFGGGEQVFCSLANVDVIDWAPLPTIIPMVGERVVDEQTGEEVVAVEWTVNEVRVQPPGRPEDTYARDRRYVKRLDSVIHM
jgi:hypothetical protein